MEADAGGADRAQGSMLQGHRGFSRHRWGRRKTIPCSPTPYQQRVHRTDYFMLTSRIPVAQSIRKGRDMDERNNDSAIEEATINRRTIAKGVAAGGLAALFAAVGTGHVLADDDDSTVSPDDDAGYKSR